MSKKRKTTPGIPAGLALPQFQGTLWDTHTHLDTVVRHLKNVSKTHEVEVYPVSEIARAAVSSGICGILHCACELNLVFAIDDVLDEVSAVDGVECAAAVAIHPIEAVLHEAGKGGRPEVLAVAPDGLDLPKLMPHHNEYPVEEATEKIYEVAKADARIKVVGETGLDYFRTADIGKSIQKESFREHIRIANELNLPVQVHDRDAHEDVVSILKEAKPEVALLHSFSGDESLAQVCIENGWYMSFSGVVTFKSAQSLRDAFKLVLNAAPELLLIETDAPFLTPAPHRGSINAPAMISHTLTYLAEHFELDIVRLCEQIADNQRQLLTR
ncbi:MAG: TatD family hydrolase [Candidatus Ancillula trichonymphae]|jgi:TatD DNase family protein|nr:TatD family hydrolase [Candidatus Ancillula trichonymphae]